MISTEEIVIKSPEVKSLCWNGDTLVDLVKGGNKYFLDGSFQESRNYIPYRFDTAILSPSRKYSCVYEKLGTKGILFKGEEILREINRSYYFANAFEYPITFAQLTGDKEIIIHCPNEYNRIEIEDVETGECLTESISRKPSDFFHSRFSVSPDNLKLMSSGWFWHPMDYVRVYNLNDAINNPHLLDNEGLELTFNDLEIPSASFINDEEILFYTSDENLDYDSPKEILPQSLTVFNIKTRNIVTTKKIRNVMGTIMPLTRNYAVSFFNYPKVINIKTGEIAWKLNEINTGKQKSSILDKNEKIPVMAFDCNNKRFAIALKDKIKVIKFLINGK